MHLIPAQRQQIILKTLEQREVVSIAELTEALAVSHMTIRRDIVSLEQAGKVLLVSGGVRRVEQIEAEPSRNVKAALQSTEKAMISQAAGAIVPSGATVYLDAGTTCLAIAVQLAPRGDLTVLTNDFVIVSYLIENSQCALYHTGGHVIRQNESCDGESAARFIASVNIDIGFISASSWDMHYISTPTESKVPVKQAVVAASVKKILVSDATKYGKAGFFKAIPLKSLDAIITDSSLDPRALKAIRALGLEVIVAESDMSA